MGDLTLELDNLDDLPDVFGFDVVVPQRHLILQVVPLRRSYMPLKIVRPVLRCPGHLHVALHAFVFHLTIVVGFEKSEASFVSSPISTTDVRDVVTMQVELRLETSHCQGKRLGGLSLVRLLLYAETSGRKGER